jgi:spermidine synthase
LRATSRLSLLALAFTLSGAAALVAEQVFEKLLSTLVGATTPAGAIVLSVYFAGLTAGALLYPRLRRVRALRPYLYPLLELAVAVACVVLTLRLHDLVPAFAPLLRFAVDRPALLAAMRAVVAAIWILPLTIPMGATFPALVDVADRVAPDRRDRSMSALYAFNLAGAILAAVGAPIGVFPRIGLSGGLALAAAFDVVAAVVALVVVRAADPALPARDDGVTPVASSVPPAILAFGAATGAILFGLEVVWTHLSCAVIGNSVYGFAAMLSSVLLGLGAGGAASALLFGRASRVPAWAPGAALIAGAIALVGLHGLWPHAPRAVAWLGSGARSFAGQELARFAIAAGLVVPPAAVLGAAYPLLFRVPSFPEGERGRAAGKLAAVNALGCITGSLVTGFALLPWLGSEATERALVVASAIVGAAAVATSASGGATRRRAIAGAFAAVASFALPRWNLLELASGAHVYFRPSYDVDEARLLWSHEDTRGGITTIVRTESSPIKTLFTNGKFQGDDGTEMRAQTAFALVPMQFVPRFDRALVIGLGTGRTAHVVSAMGFGAVDVAEIAPGIVAAARGAFSDVNGGVLSRPNVTLFLEDGRNCLLLRDTRYDLITIELTSVWFAGVTNLYSREFYELARSRLTEGGVLQQWIQLHHITLTEIGSVIATMRAVFPNVSFYSLGGQGLVVASAHPQEVQPAFVEQAERHQLEALLGAPTTSAALAALAEGRVLGPADVDRFVTNTEAPINTDANRFVEYATPRYAYRTDDMLSPNLFALHALAGR